MKHLQKKIWLLAIVVLIIMVVIWMSLTYYNQKMQDQYNQILERYLIMNELNMVSQELVGSLNSYVLTPSDENIRTVERHKSRMNVLYGQVSDFRNAENASELTNYMNLTVSLVEMAERAINFQAAGETEPAKTALNEALHIADYVSEMRLSVIDKELVTYDIVYREIIDRSEKLNELGVWLLISIILLLLFFTYWFSLRITQPLEKLTNSARQLAKGRFDIKIESDSKDETAILAGTFEQMRSNLNQLFIETKQKAKLEAELQESKYLLKESQLLSLQSQINPHFLFNTLNTLSKKAYMDGSAETSDLLVSIADLLRYNLRHMDRPTALREEIYVLEQYIHIQKARYTDRLTFIHEIDEAGLDTLIPGLTLQPIVENAIIHAVEPSEHGGTIWFRLKNEPDRVIIEVEDDGPGISNEKIDELMAAREITSEKSTGIGFKNVVQRLRLFNGSEQVVQIESERGKGTKIILYIFKKEAVPVNY
ncbi:sensor histidine kinase [Jeotgalibacillus proteolyticus]|uniref:histidine kinase n=1 Tax=Jeotgalibacillus proteolyticus TaxID=2082395 RepID=A0A2S5G8Q2_9BACL|nr:histidine kinase [Jeotgalibacillus proteolyticus]PPA69358.1 two-component sensor histidine kinase [Jeotgalibacillus proteolyticus]